MSLIIIIAIIWITSTLIRSAREKRAREKAQRIAYEQARIKREMREIRQQANEEVAARIALEREQMRQRREQEKIAKEQEKQAKAQAAAWEKQRREDERRDAQIAKHEERLLRLEQKLELAQREEDHYSDEVSAIRIDMAGLEGYINYCKSKGLLCKGKETELEKLNKKLFAAETKMIKARQTRELCEMQMSA